MTGAGRFAPSPSGDLHLGNLRTALLAWLFARSTDRRFLVRVEDLDRVRPGAAARQLADLAALGLDWDAAPVRQSERADRYTAAIAALSERGLTYECFCTRREIAQAATAAHGDPVPDGAYPGTCRNLTTAERAQRRRDRPAALRLRTDVARWTVHDDLRGDYTGAVDDLVLRRNDGVAAYNLAVVVDDAAQAIDQVVRGDDLLPSTPRQAYLAGLFDEPTPSYAHVPLAVNPAGRRLAKRDGAVTMAQLPGPAHVRALLAQSLGLPDGLDDMLAAFDPARLPRHPWFVPRDLVG